MASESLTITKADENIRFCIDNHESFVLDAGAGSGKTRSLIETLRYLIDAGRAEKLEQSSQRIACITYTNVAKDEIIQRTANSPLIHVSTIHDFLWNCIKPYQKELKNALIQYNDNLSEKSSRKCNRDELKTSIDNFKVTYSDRGAKFLEGRIFHDDLIGIAHIMFSEHPLLAKIIAARYPFVFVDEYQDTDPKVVDILVDFILSRNAGSFVVGFFGDKLQNIYQSGVGELSDEHKAYLETITKAENYRCSESVIRVLNKIRSDIKQEAAGENVKGSAVYINANTLSNQIEAIERVRNYLREILDWSFEEDEQKELYLTHKLIADKAGYENLYSLFNNRGNFERGAFLDGEDVRIKFFREKVQPIVVAWEENDLGKVLSLLRANEYVFNEMGDKTRAKQGLVKLCKLIKSGSKIRDVLNHLASTKLLSLLDVFKEYLNESEDTPDTGDEEALREQQFYNDLFDVSYKEVVSFLGFLDEHTPFTTKHGTKGAEFPTVLVILDDKGAKWNQYSFDKYFSGEDEGKDRFNRTRNLFYVCCSRAIVNLAVVDLGAASERKMQGLHNLFGKENCYTLS